MDNISDENNTLPEELTNLSFQELFELKNKIGNKAYNELISGKRKQEPTRNFHRENKNRPREMSSKIKPSVNQYVSKPVLIRDKKPVDPRFSNSYGEFCQQVCSTIETMIPVTGLRKYFYQFLYIYDMCLQEFEQNYKFIDGLKKKERKVLRKQLEDPEVEEEERSKIQSLLQRMENQRKEKVRTKKKEKTENFARDYQIQELKEGRKPQYCKKSDKKLFDLVQHFEELKEKGGLIRHIKRRQKKMTQKDRRKLKFLRTSKK